MKLSFLKFSEVILMSQSKQRLLKLNARLAQNLADKGVEATAEETTTALVEKVKSIELGTNS